MSEKHKLKREGETFTTKEGYKIKIIEYFGYENCTIQFEDGTILYNKRMVSIFDGGIRKPYNRIGETHTMNSGYSCTIIEYLNANNCTIQFEDGTVLTHIRYRTLLKGGVKNYNFPNNYGIGYIGYGTYDSTSHPKAFITWRAMLRRCYDLKYQEKHSTYKGCSVDECWHSFQVFAEWHCNYYNTETMKKWDLDKDTLIKGNKIYSPETCRFIPKEINGLSLYTNSKNKLSLGVYKVDDSYVARLHMNGKTHHIGSFKTILEASNAYKTAKETYVKSVANKWKGLIDNDVYEILINYKL
jgi:hypothetical protein